MNALAAIFTRALREHTRSRTLAFARGGFAAMVVWLMLAQNTFDPVTPGLSFLHGLLVMNGIFILLAATSYFSSAITEEKEEGTIALLIMANVSATGLLLAKSSTRILEGLLLLAVQFPFALMAITLGGVTWEQIIASYLTLGAFVFLAGNLALLASLVASRTTAAVAGTAALLGLALAVETLNPFNRLGQITSLTFAGPIVGEHFKSSIGVGIIAFGVARLLFERFSKPTADSGPGWLSRFSSTAQDRMNAPRPVSRMAIEWKDYHFLYGGQRMSRWKMRGYVILSMFIVAIHLPDFHRATVVYIGMSVTALGLFGWFAESCYIASRMFAAEHQSKTLGALVLSPCTFYLEHLIEAKERIARAALLPAIRTTGVGLVILGIVVLAEEGIGSIAAIAVVATFIGLLIPFWLIHMTLLRRIIVHFSLRMAWGSIALGIVVWIIPTLIVTSIMAVVVPIVGAYLVLIPAYFLSKRMEKKNIALIHKLAAEEG